MVRRVGDRKRMKEKMMMKMERRKKWRLIVNVGIEESKEEILDGVMKKRKENIMDVDMRIGRKESRREGWERRKRGLKSIKRSKNRSIVRGRSEEKRI